MSQKELDAAKARQEADDEARKEAAEGDADVDPDKIDAESEDGDGHEIHPDDGVAPIDDDISEDYG